MTYIVSPRGLSSNSRILVVGCGGTGGYVAEGLCRLLTGTSIPLVLIDHDRVELHNLLRQHFYPGDVGKFKSQVMAERLARQYGRPIMYSVYPYDNDMIEHEYGGGLVSRMNQGIIIGCVDETESRKSIASNFPSLSWWIDAGNGRSSGQVLIGNAKSVNELQWSFHEKEQEVRKLPLPSLQLPSLLVPPEVPVKETRDCAEAVANDEQSPVINQAMATLVLQFVYRFLTNTLTWMGAYIDLDAGSLTPVPAEPETVARMFGLKVNSLVMNGESISGRYYYRR